MSKVYEVSYETLFNFKNVLMITGEKEKANQALDKMSKIISKKQPSAVVGIYTHDNIFGVYPGLETGDIQLVPVEIISAYNFSNLGEKVAKTISKANINIFDPIDKEELLKKNIYKLVPSMTHMLNVVKFKLFIPVPSTSEPYTNKDRSFINYSRSDEVVTAVETGHALSVLESVKQYITDTWVSLGITEEIWDIKSAAVIRGDLIKITHMLQDPVKTHEKDKVTIKLFKKEEGLI